MFPEDNARSISHALASVTLPPNVSPAERAFDVLVDEVKQFETALTEGEAVGAMLASFGQAIKLQISSISRAGQFFCFDGLTEQGDEARLVQHFTQTSILLVKLKNELPRRPIGFVAD
ncbi:DUF6173 family protein [Paraburkholderia fungorum]|uniref:DUF6173 family protein n=1 Tax=Paraburkholderia fungorum TaxID=134537 RepID=UPI0038BD2687